MPRETLKRASLATTCVLLAALPISGQNLSPTPASTPPDQRTTSPPPEAGKVTAGGYVEAFWSYNLNHPSNRITNFRGFDNRESTISISNAVASLAWEKAAVSGKITAQAGLTPNTYYLAEPASPGTSSTGAADATTTWKYLQEAWIGYRAPIGRGVLFQAGIFLSPIGVENMPIKDNWNWSRSNLFFGLPFYHAGIKATYELSRRWTAELMICNGWNDIVDNNRQKSVDLSTTYKASDTLSFHFLYFGGVERPTGAPEGEPWRHLFDAFATWDATKTLSFILHADAGFEKNTFGTSDWAAVAGYIRVKLSGQFFIAARADYFWEHVASNSSGTASALFWPGKRVASETLTLDFRPLDNISVRLEGRHDGGSTEMFFRGRVAGDGSTAVPYVANARSQDTLTLGATSWF